MLPLFIKNINSIKAIVCPRQKAGTCFERAWGIYTYANLAISLSLNILSIAENEVAINESWSGRPLVSHGSTNPTIMSVSLLYSALSCGILYYTCQLLDSFDKDILKLSPSSVLEANTFSKCWHSWFKVQHPTNLAYFQNFSKD